MEVKLKQGQKFCKNCKSVNPIRSFICKSCQFVFPSKKSESDGNKLLGSNYLSKNICKENGLSFDVNSKLPILVYLEKIIREFELLVANNINIEDSESQEGLYETVIFEVENEVNRYGLGEQEESLQIKIKEFEKIEYKIDCFKSWNENNTELKLLLVIFLFSTELKQKFTYKIITIEIPITKSSTFSNLNQRIKERKLDYSIQEYEMNEEIVSAHVKIVSLNIFIISVNNHFNVVWLSNVNKSKSVDTNLSQIQIFQYSIEKVNKYDLSNHYISALDVELNNNHIKLIISDSSFRIYYFICRKLKESSKAKILDLNIPKNGESCFSYTKDGIIDLFTLVSIYENFFFSKVTDLKFISLNETGDVENNSIIKEHAKEKSFFIACSKDGFVKLFDTLNTSIVRFKYKTQDIWINKLAFDMSSQIIYFMVNLPEKVYGLKFSGNKEPLIKKIPFSSNCIHFSVDHQQDRFILLDTDGKISYYNNSFISSYFDKYKLKFAKEVKATQVYQYPKTDKIEDYFGPSKFFYFSVRKNDEETDDKEQEIEEFSDIKEIKTRNTKSLQADSILVIPTFSKIVIKLINTCT